MLCAGIVIPLCLAYAKYAAAKEWHWVKVAGRILVSRVDFDWEDYRPNVEYVYCYNGTEYRGEKIRSLLPVYNFKGPAERLCARYPGGATVDVYVDPGNPSDSVLEPGGDAWLRWLGLLVSLLLIVLGALLVAA